MKKNCKKKDNLNNKEEEKINLDADKQECGENCNEKMKEQESEQELPINESEQNEKEESKVEKLEKKCDEYFTKMQKVVADFENYKKRVAKEKQTTYADALIEAVETFLPLMDNFERALNTPSNCEKDPFREGVEMLFKQFQEAFFKIGVKEINSVGESFDPKLHNAVMHVEDDNFSEGEITEELQKGYRLGDKVVRHSMVKVAN